MKCKLFVAVLALSSFAFAQHGGGRPADAGAGAGGMGMGSSTGHPGGMGSDMGPGMSAGHDANGSMGHSGSSMSSASGKSASDLLTQNTKLSSNLQKLLPQGMTPQDACSGFKNLGQCVAAIHVSHNLDIPFADLKAKTTGSGSVSLGKAIETLKPGTNGKTESKKGQKQANEDLKNS
ncbi:MAG TPA: hypothetical protein VFU86_21480 [Terriglobales bacterium]|nr:hypothetical protein [Terriglobales bacterium]